MNRLVNKNTCLKEDCFLCKNIMSEWLEVVRLKREVLTYKKGEHLFREGEKVRGVFFILTGKVKVDMAWGDKSFILRLAGEGDIVGHRGFGIDDVYPVNATTLETTTVCFIPTDLFKHLLKTNPEFLYELTFFYADELKLTERRMKNLVHMSVKGRVAEAILHIRNAFGIDQQHTLSYNMSRKDMASMAGTTYETVIRMLNELVKDGFIELHGKEIKLLDQQGLSRCCGM